MSDEKETEGKFCPFMSNEEYNVRCETNCAIYDEKNERCGILSLAKKVFSVKNID